MKKLTIVLALALLAAPAALASNGFSVYGTGWRTDVSDDVGGGGVEMDFGKLIGGEFRGAYYQELTTEPFQQVLDVDSPFEAGINATPLEAGLRINFNDEDNGGSGMLHPHIAAGGSFFALDTDVGQIDDEFGYYALAGLRVGNGRGVDFLAEANHRWIEGTVTDLGDVGLDEDVTVDLGGFGVNVGLSWKW